MTVAHPVAARRLGVVRLSGAHASSLTGAAIVHQQLATHLAGSLPGTQIDDDFRIGANLFERVMGQRYLDDADVAITTSTPLPVRAPAKHVIPIVYDVRWRWTRGPVARAYRHADLARSARGALHLLTISHTVAEHLRALRIDADSDVTVLDLGPGQLHDVPPASVPERKPSVLLMGRAPHKRNELAAKLLAQIPQVRADYQIIAVSISDEVRSILQTSFRPSQLSIHDGVERDEFVRIVSKAGTYLALGYSEGFGFPYIETAYLGCDVIAPKQSLTIEVLGDDGLLLESPDPTAAELWAALEGWDLARVQRLHARAIKRDWHKTAEQLARVLGRLVADIE